MSLHVKNSDMISFDIKVVNILDMRSQTLCEMGHDFYTILYKKHLGLFC